MLTMCKMHIRLTGQAHTHLTLNRYAPVGETNSYKMEKSFFLKRLLSGKGKYVSV